MKRQLPKNIRQIGNVSDSSKIYVEDYVDTFFNQLCDKAEQMPIGAFLVGEIVREEEEEYIYIYGAIRMQEVTMKGKDIHIEDGVWKNACQICKEYFGNAEILGWFLTIPGQALGVNHNLMKLHQRLFSRELSIFVMKDAVEKEEQFYIYKYHELMECPGHYVYYEKNEEMQNYMIASRKKLGVTPSEIVEDRITKDFRNVVREKMKKNTQKASPRFVYAASAVLVVLVLGIGITMVNNYDRMSDVRETLGSMVQNLRPGNRADEDQEKKDKPEIDNAQQDNNTQQADNTQQTDDTQQKDNAQQTDGTQQSGSAQQNDEAQKPDGDLHNSGNAGNDGDTTEGTENSKPVSGPIVNENEYIVEKGDTLATISRKIYGDMGHIEEICKANGLEDGNLIFIGQKLLLP